jgi:hypothetical protein
VLPSPLVDDFFERDTIAGATPGHNNHIRRSSFDGSQIGLNSPPAASTSSATQR